MAYYRMGRYVPADGTLIYKRSHDLFRLKTGSPLAEGFDPPFVAELDPDHLNGVLPTFYTSPAWIARKQFYDDLCETGVDNVETLPVIINDINGRVIEHYLLLNIIGSVACADMRQSEYEALGEGMDIIDTLVIDPKKASGLDLFVVHEDTDCMVISERVYKHLNSKGYGDVYFEELAEAG